MQETVEQHASAFMLAVAQQQKMLLRLALSLTKDKDLAHDLYADTLLKCRERIAAHGFNGEGYLAYMITSIKFNHFYSKRTNLKLDFTELARAQEQDEDREERQALAAGVRAFIVAHFPTEEVAAFELHTHGLSLSEIVFLTDYRNKLQLRRVVMRIKKEVRAAFGR